MKYLLTKKRLDIFSPGTFEHLPFTNRAYGAGIDISISTIEELQKTNPKAYIYVLFLSGKAGRFIQVRNIVIKEICI